MQEQTIGNYGIDESIKELAANYQGFTVCRILNVERTMYQIVTESGFYPAKLSGKYQYTLLDETDIPTVGDFALIKENNQSEIQLIEAVLPRKTMLFRNQAGQKSKTQLIASNIDTVFICMDIDTDFNLQRLDRYLAICYTSKARPVIVLTKADLVPSTEEKIDLIASSHPQVDIIFTSNKSEDGYQEIEKYLIPNQTYAFIGSSGVGKSTMINNLLSSNVQVTGDVRKDQHGRHTTTSRQMILADKGWILIDTPGMREIQLDESDMSEAFQDIIDLSEECKFRDCQHINEPGCKVISAIEEGTLPYSRYRNYQKMLLEVARTARRISERKNEKHGSKSKPKNKFTRSN